jgi:hypothetical protein
VYTTDDWDKRYSAGRGTDYGELVGEGLGFGRVFHPEALYEWYGQISYYNYDDPDGDDPDHEGPITDFA